MADIISGFMKSITSSIYCNNRPVYKCIAGIVYMCTLLQGISVDINGTCLTINKH